MPYFVMDKLKRRTFKSINNNGITCINRARKN